MSTGSELLRYVSCATYSITQTHAQTKVIKEYHWKISSLCDLCP
jgi:hypothetical protein